MSNSKTSSTVSLLSNSRTPSSSKNFQQAFGKLSSSFGFGGSVVSAPILSTPSQDQQKQKSQQRKPAVAPAAKEDSRTTAQQTQAAYWASQSHKDFEAAYGKLAGTYGFGGAVPSPKARKV